ncbi:hypothetical protein BO71DRAFT_200293 [Aspergillus ellipticus CBS 707.79]|uniref:Uncharacterized protein n=1 Tax=Aspergillus ellipticus CBS 707.79 TaxID=1448320 RepID=A0A319E4K6_9EURO|nr:hypothetical protein BO71DRAFT_200293 [Aspergillus ellipticus CBS 707.79]
MRDDIKERADEYTGMPTKDQEKANHKTPCTITTKQQKEKKNIITSYQARVIAAFYRLFNTQTPVDQKACNVDSQPRMQHNRGSTKGNKLLIGRTCMNEWNNDRKPALVINSSEEQESGRMKEKESHQSVRRVKKVDGDKSREGKGRDGVGVSTAKGG